MKKIISQAVAITLVFAQSVFFFPVKLSSVEVQFVKFPYYFNTYPDGLDIITQNVIDEALESVIRHVETEMLEVYVPLIAPSESKLITASEGGVVELEEARIIIPPGALEEDTQISITRLFSTQDTEEGIKNATVAGGGYRFLPA
ncbi:MAG: hypothetical protein FWD47_06220, partial [Treponema sp.]|nr:hypothetical protein [Treponema sp.]